MNTMLARIDAALERAAFRQLTVRAIYLTRSDHDAFDRAMNPRFKRKASWLAYGDHQIRRGASSYIHCKYGVDVCIQKRLSARVRREAA